MKMLHALLLVSLLAGSPSTPTVTPSGEPPSSSGSALADDVKTATSVLAVALSSLSLWLTLRDKKRERRSALYSALQGEKQAISYAALRLHRNPDYVPPEERSDLVAALTLSWVMESSDRVHALILAAFRRLATSDRQAVDDAIAQLDEIFALYGNTPDADIERGKKRLEKLRGALSGLQNSEGPR